MKNFLIFLLLVILIINSVAQNVSAPDKSKNILKINFLVLPLASLNVNYERQLCNYLSFQMQGIYLYHPVYVSIDNYTKSYTSYCGFSTSIRVYLDGKSMSGIYFSPFFGFNRDLYSNYNKEGESGNGENINEIVLKYGLCVGYQWIVKNKFTFEILGKPAFSVIKQNGDIYYTDQTIPYGYTPVNPHFSKLVFPVGATVGYEF